MLRVANVWLDSLPEQVFKIRPKIDDDLILDKCKLLLAKQKTHKQAKEKNQTKPTAGTP